MYYQNIVVKAINECLGPPSYTFCKWFCYITPINSFKIDIGNPSSSGKRKSKPTFEFTEKMITDLGEIKTPSSYYEA